ncbi:peptidoglycan-binding protein [Actinophytocola sediminis]
MGRARRWLIGGGVAVAVVAVGATVTAMALTGSPAESPAARPLATAPVTKQDLAETRTVSGALDYGPAHEIVGGQAGTLTWLAGAGETVERGAPLYTVDERPVIAMYGTVPMYRDLRPGSEGGDVTQLEKNLRALGYDGFDVDAEYTAATASAVRDWQDDLGLAETGTVERGRVVFVPAAVRIAEWTGQLGGPATGPVLSYTGATLVVTADLDAADQRLAKVGDPVTVQLPDGATTAKVTAATTLSTVDDKQDDAAAVRLTMAVADQKSLAALEGGTPVDVDLVAQRRADVLTVPVAALLALAEGGYGVEVVDKGTSRIVAVETGMFAGGQVEVSAPDLAAGQRVGVPS